MVPSILAVEKKKTRFFYGYIVIAASFIIQGIGIGTLNTFGVFFKPLLNEFGWSRATISGASSSAFFLLGLISILAGSLNDRFGPRLIMALSALFCGLGYLLMSQVDTVWQLYLFYGVIVGTGMSSNDVVTLSTTARWFVQKRGLMTGIVKVGTGAGLMIMPLVASGLISAYGWRYSYIIIGILILVFILLLSQLMRRDPGQMGQLPNGGTEKSDARADLSADGLSLREAIRTRQFWTVCLINLIVVFCILTIMVHIAPYAMDIGISTANAAGILSTIGGVSMLGRLVMGITSDRIGSKRSMIVCFLILVAGLFWLQVAEELWMLYLFAVVHGFAHGGLFTLISPLVAGLFGMISHGVIFGVVIFSGTIGGAVGPVLAGYIFDISNSYQSVFLILSVLGISGLALTLLLRPGRSQGLVGNESSNSLTHL